MATGFQRQQAQAGDNSESYSRRPMSQAGQKAVDHPHDKLHLQKYARKSIGAHARIIPAASTGENRSMSCKVTVAWPGAWRPRFASVFCTLTWAEEDPGQPTEHSGVRYTMRSEEHTSELQSLRHLVC